MTKYKTADDTRNSTTLSDDTHLAGFAFDADSYYKIEGFFLMEVAGTTGDIKFQPQFSNTPQDMWWHMDVAHSTSGAAGKCNQYSSTLWLNLTNNTAAYGGSVSGFIRSNASTGGTMDIQFAQQLLDASNVTTLKIGSWMTITKIS